MHAVNGVQDAGHDLRRQTDEPERLVERLTVGEAPPDIIFEGGSLLRIVVGFIQQQPAVGHDDVLPTAQLANWIDDPPNVS